MRNIAEPLYEVETIINHHMEIIHKLTAMCTNVLQGQPESQRPILEAASSIWFYLKPVHIWIRDQNPTQKEFYDSLDKLLEARDKNVTESKKKGKK